MTRYKTTNDFIHLCKEYKGQERLSKLAENLKISERDFKLYAESIDKCCNFVSHIDTQYHKLADDEDSTAVFLGHTLHSHISSDIRAIILLTLLKQNYQSNVILRHLIEIFGITFWGDLCSGFGDSLDMFLDTDAWKPYRSTQRMTWKSNPRYPNRSIQERLERIRLLNMIKMRGKRFYNYYFSKASGCDLALLFFLPICKECVDKRGNQLNWVKFHLDQQLRRRGKEDRHAVFKTDFCLICGICGRQRIATGLALGIPEPNDMFDMLAARFDGIIVNRLRDLQKLYEHLSEEYVHFSTTVHPDYKPPNYDLGYGKRSIWGLSGLEYLIDVIKPLVEFYFKQLRKEVRSV